MISNVPNLFPIHAPYIATSLSYGGITRRIAVAQPRLRFYKSINQCKTVGLVLPAAGKYISIKEQVRKLPVLWQVQHLVRVQVDLVAARLGNAASQVRCDAGHCWHWCCVAGATFCEIRELLGPCIGNGVSVVMLEGDFICPKHWKWCFLCDPGRS